MTNLERPTLVNNKGFLESARDAGLTTLDAVCELFDNSLDAGANNLEVNVEKNGKYMRISVIDDGVGIPEAIKGYDGKTYDGVAWALSFGGRAPTGVPGTSIGKFGAGLTYAACCQSLRTDIYTKTVADGRTRHNFLDLEELGQSMDLHVPLSSRKDPPATICGDWSERPSGTIVVFEKCDNPDREQVNKMAELLMGHLGMVYRRFIVGGRTIKVNGKALEPKDPLFATPGGWHTYDPDALKGASPPDAIPLVKKAGVGPGHIVYDRAIEFPEYPDETGEPHKVQVRIVWLDVLTIRNNPNYANQFMTKHGLTEEKQGFYLMRNDRQIAEAESFGPHGIFVRNADLNYFRGEISFPPALDKVFGIQQNKSRFSLKGSVKAKLEGEVGRLIERDIRQQTRLIINAWKDEKKAEAAAASGPSPAEKVMKKATTVLKAPSPIDPAEVVAQQKAQEAQTREAIAKVETNPALDAGQKERLLAEIKAAAERAKLPFAVAVETIADGCFYHVRRLGKQVVVVVNGGHEFHSLFSKASEHPAQRALLELMLLTASHGEAQFDPEEERSEMNMADAIESFRHHWSVGLNVVLKKMRDEEKKLFHEEELLPA